MSSVDFYPRTIESYPKVASNCLTLLSLLGLDFDTTGDIDIQPDEPYGFKVTFSQGEINLYYLPDGTLIKACIKTV